MYTWLYKHARLLLPRGRALHRDLQELLHTQWLSPADLQALQLRKLKRLVEHASTNVPFYRQRFQEVEFHPDDLKTLDDIRRIPILTREDVQRNLELLKAANIPSHEFHQDATGGSTGEPLKFYYRMDWTYWNWAAGFRVWSWYGVEQGCRQAWIAGREFVISPRLSQKIQSRLRREKWLNSFDMSEGKLQVFAETLVRFKPELIVAYNSSLWLFAQYLDKHHITGIQPKVVIGGADKLYDFQRELVEKVFGCPLVDYYASRENGVMAGQCPQGSVHVSAELRYLEIVADGRPAEPGEIGEVVVTDLTNFAMPFIRYKNGDLARCEDQPCSCGRGLPVLREIVGRTSDFFTTPEGKLISGLYFVHRLRGWPGVKKYQVHQSAVDKVEIFFEAGDAWEPEWTESRRQEFQAHLGESVQLSFKRVEHLAPTPAGKHLFTTSTVPVNLSGRKSDNEQVA